MRNNILIFICGFGLAFCMAATNAENLFTVKPALPKSVIVKNFTRWDTTSTVSKFIKKNVSKGFIVKSIIMSDNAVFVVMEKY